MCGWESSNKNCNGVYILLVESGSMEDSNVVLSQKVLIQFGSLSCQNQPEMFRVEPWPRGVMKTQI